MVNNIFVSTGERDNFYTFIKDAKPPHVYAMMSDNIVDNNLYYSVNNPGFEMNTVLTDLRKNGFDGSSVYADPLFENWIEGDFRLKAASPALKIGIEQVDIKDKVGLTKDFPLHLRQINE